jgi:sterol desaturase/sphingolipid hydroxylase (fatty acid hydroxylase superfamily)
MIDLKIFIFGRGLATLGLAQLVFAGAFVAYFISGLFGEGLGLPPVHPILMTFILLAGADFSTYWVHRIHHESRVFWPFHSVHHSAEVMTPVTVYRKHPIYDLMGTVLRGVIMGIVQGVLAGLFLDDVTFVMVMGINAGYLVFNMVGANLRHSHVWLSYGRVIEHILISPAQHQIHHSLAPEHHNRNYGEVLAIWDWMFGTLYIPAKRMDIQFGLGDAHGNRLPQRHDTLTNAMLVPMRDSWKQIRRMTHRARTKSGSALATDGSPAMSTTNTITPAE